MASNRSSVLRHVTAFVIVAIVVVARATPSASARGQQSYRVPERVLAVAAAPRPVLHAAWSAPVDRELPLGPTLALTPEIVAFSSGNRICAFAHAGGARRWCSGPGTNAVEAAGVIAFLDQRGGVHAVDARTGRSRWDSAFGAGRFEPNVPAYGSGRLWSTGSSFLVAGAMALRTSTPRFGELSVSGTTLWEDRLIAPRAPFIANRYALVHLVGSGATLDFAVRIVRLGAHGGVGPFIGNAESVLGTWHGNAVLVAGSRAQYGEDTFLSREIELAAIPSGRTVEDRVLEPDYEANLAANRARGSEAYNDTNAFEDGYVYTSVVGNLYRYDLRGRDDQRPLLLSSRAPFVGGPVRGTVYVARRDGVWALTADQRSIAARLVVATASPAVAFTAHWPNAYMGFADGTLRGVDVRDGSTTLSATGCLADRIVADARQAFFVCRGDTWRLLAFANPAR
jgi:putative pyrroloquinoline-quinone binding quinoprotein